MGDVQSVTNDFRQYSEVLVQYAAQLLCHQTLRPSHMVSVGEFCTFCKLCRKVVPGRKWPQNMNGTLKVTYKP